LQDGCSGFSQCDVGLKRRSNVEGSIFQAGRQRRAVLDGLRASMFPPQHEPKEAGSTITYQLSLRIEYVKEPAFFVATSHTYFSGVQMEYLNNVSSFEESC
jgi:hypothetical protein